MDLVRKNHDQEPCLLEFGVAVDKRAESATNICRQDYGSDAIHVSNTGKIRNLSKAYEYRSACT